jgi:hypothetical protein
MLTISYHPRGNGQLEAESLDMALVTKLYMLASDPLLDAIAAGWELTVKECYMCTLTAMC